MSYKQKTFLYKVYTASPYMWDTFYWDKNKWDREKDRLVTTWKNEVLNDLTFKNIINGGEGEVVVKLARKYDDYGENIDIKINNKVEIYVYDKEEPNGQLIYKGFITGYTPVLDNETEFVEVRITGFGVTLSNSILKDFNGNTTVSYSNVDVSTMFKDIIDKFIVLENGKLGYNYTEIEDTQVVVSYTFNTVSYREALNKCVELAPAGWYWRIEPNGMIAFKVKSNEVIHQFNSQKDINYLKSEKNIEDFYNEVLFIGGDTGSGNLFVRKRNVNSQDVYGTKVLKYVDNQVTNSDTAEIIIDRILDEKSIPVRRTRLSVIDSNGNGENGYDIESVKVGETILVGELTRAVPEPVFWDNFAWDINVWDNVLVSNPSEIMQIISISYKPDYLEIEATTRASEISKRIEDINKKLEGSVFVNNPTIPTLLN